MDGLDGPEVGVCVMGLPHHQHHAHIHQVSKFQSVSSLTIFFCENFGGDSTSVSYIGFKGEVTSVRGRACRCIWVGWWSVPSLSFVDPHDLNIPNPTPQP